MSIRTVLRRGKRRGPQFTNLPDGDKVQAKTGLLITSISEIMAKPFFLKCCNGDYSPIGEGTPEQLHAAFINLLSQYYQARKSADQERETRLQLDITTLHQRQVMISLNLSALGIFYVESAADKLREVFTKFGTAKYQLTQDTYERDIKTIASGEIANKIKLDQMRATLNNIHQGRDASVDTVQREIALYNKVAAMCEYSKVAYSLDKLTVIEFAIQEYRYDQYIKQLEKQLKKSK